MRQATVGKLPALVAAVLLVAAAGPSGPADGPASRPGSNLDYWLQRARAATSRAAATLPSGVNPFAAGDRFSRRDALPGAVELSDGRVLAGGVHTTRDRNWEVWVESEKRWRHVPPIVVLSIEAITDGRSPDIPLQAGDQIYVYERVF